MKRILFLLSLSVVYSYAQKQDRIWCFGFNSGIDFNDTINPVPFSSVLPQNAMGSYASIADNNGNLLFYTAGIRWDTLGARVYNRNFQVMQNGDSIRGQPNRAQPLIIIPFPGDNNKYYLFSFSYISYQTALHYSIIDMQQDGGLGAVIQKNNFLFRDTLCEKMNAVRHGNGSDWWLLLRRYWDNTFYKYLITNNGILGPYFQSIGTYPGTFYGEMDFSKSGNKLVVVSTEACIDLMDFDRCTGMLNNYVDIGEHGAWNSSSSYFGCAFSPDETKLYVTTATNSNDVKRIFQYDLTSANIVASKYMIQSYADTLNFFLGEMQLAPDGKIYVAKGNAYNAFENTIYDQNLDYVANPNDLGQACNYCSNCFSLQGHGLCELGLPNMPNYNLGTLIGSPCDSLTSTNNLQQVITNCELFVYYDAGWQTAFINAKGLQGKSSHLQIFDINGKEVFSISKNISPPYFTHDVNVSRLSNGIYLVRLQTKKEVLQKKLIKD
jgi:hypothetical protein